MLRYHTALKDRCGLLRNQHTRARDALPGPTSPSGPHPPGARLRVKEVTMASACRTCGTKLGLFQRIAGDSQCKPCVQREAEEREKALETYRARLDLLVRGAGASHEDLASLGRGLPALARRAALSADSELREKIEALKRLIHALIADDQLSEEDEHKLSRAMELVEVDGDALSTRIPELVPEIVVARINAGRLTPMKDPRLMLKRGEVAYLQVDASLLKEVIDREWQGRSSGYSFRVVKGVRYHVGATRGHQVVVGSHSEVADRGSLWVTSQRAAFIGARQTIDLPHSKLLQVQVYTDGIRFNVSNRKQPPLFKLTPGMGIVVAAATNFAAQHMDT